MPQCHLLRSRRCLYLRSRQVEHLPCRALPPLVGHEDLPLLCLDPRVTGCENHTAHSRMTSKDRVPSWRTQRCLVPPVHILMEPGVPSPWNLRRGRIHTIPSRENFRSKPTGQYHTMGTNLIQYDSEILHYDSVPGTWSLKHVWSGSKFESFSLRIWVCPV